MRGGRVVRGDSLVFGTDFFENAMVVLEIAMEAALSVIMI